MTELTLNEVALLKERMGFADLETRLHEIEAENKALKAANKALRARIEALGVRFYHSSTTARKPRPHVRCWGMSGKNMLVASFSQFVKGGCRPWTEECFRARKRPAFESLQRRKPRPVRGWMSRVRSMGI
jgi:hypothetical protein